jgi:hypothetical protein
LNVNNTNKHRQHKTQKKKHKHIKNKNKTTIHKKQETIEGRRPEPKTRSSRKAGNRESKNKNRKGYDRKNLIAMRNITMKGNFYKHRNTSNQVKW